MNILSADKGVMHVLFLDLFNAFDVVNHHMFFIKFEVFLSVKRYNVSLHVTFDGAP